MKIKRVSKSERLIYIIIFLWVMFGVLGIYYSTNLAQLAGYYSSLTLFTATYLWGEYKRTSTSTHFLKKGRSSSREIVITITIFLWAIFGVFGVILGSDINQLTVYFAALTPFVSSYIIYKTTKGNDLPIFDGKTQEMIDKNTSAVSNSSTTKEEIKITPGSKEDDIVTTDENKPKENESSNEDAVF
jgi:hypothetical protein